jgi:putative flippase GtrA
MKHILRQFTGRQAHPVIQFIKYGIAGGLATAVDVLAFYLAAIFILPALTPDDPVAGMLGLRVQALAENVRSTRFVCDKIIAFMFSNLAAYLTNMLWVFTPGRHSRAVEMGLFLMVSVVSFTIGTGLGWLLIRYGGLPTTYAYVANVVAAVAINYVCRKFIVFKG